MRGKVYQKGRRGEPIEGAPVFLKELRKGAFSDEEGAFGFLIPAGRITIRVKAIGFLPWEGVHEHREEAAKRPVEIYLLPDPKKPMQTVVREKREMASPEQVTISRKEVREKPGGLGGDVFRALQDLPGVARANGLSGALRIRGSNPADTGFAIDGHRIPLLYHFGGGPAVLSDRFLERLDFFPGGAPLAYGRLTAGLIAVESRQPEARRWGGEAFLDIIHAGFFVEIPLGEWSILVSARRSYADALIPLITSAPLAGQYWDYQAKVIWQKGDHKLSLFLFGSDDSVDYGGAQGGEPPPFLGSEPLALALRFGRAILRYQYQRSILRLVVSAAAGFDQQYSQESSQKAERWEIPVELRAEAQVQIAKSFTLAVGTDSRWSRNPYRFSLSVGEFVGFPKPGFRPLLYEGDGVKDLFSPSLYLAFQWEPWSFLSLQGGLRSDLFWFQEKFVWSLDPRLSLRAKVHPAWTILVSTGLFHRPPELQEWSSEIGNPDLGLQASVQTSVGFEFQPRKEISLRTMVFYNHMFDRVEGSGRVVEKGGKLQSERFNNDGLGRAYGMEIWLRIKDWHGFSAWVAYTLSRAERSRIGSDTYNLFSYDQPHNLNITLQYRIGWGWSVGARFRLVSGRPTTAITGSIYDADTDSYRTQSGAAQADRFPTFHQLDLRVDKEWVFQTWTFGVYLDLQNVYYSQTAEAYRFQYDLLRKVPIAGIPIIPAFGLRGSF